MSWKFPDKHFSSSGVMNTEDTNEAMRSSVEEITGQLGEQNFARNAFTTATAYEKDIAYRHAKLEVDVKGYYDGTGAESMFVDNNTAILSRNTAWQTIQDQNTGTPFRYDFVSRGGLLFITARLWGSQLTLGGGTFRLNPILFAIRLNGALIPESIDGNLDVLDYSYDRDTGNTGTFCVNIDFVAPVVPGDTTVELVARVRPQAIESKKYVPMVGSRALILWEISN